MPDNMPSKSVLAQEKKIYESEWKRLRNRCILEGGSETYCSFWAEDKMGELGWEIDNAGNCRNIFIETDRKSVLDRKIPKLILDLKDIEKKKDKVRKNLFLHGQSKGA